MIASWRVTLEYSNVPPGDDLDERLGLLRRYAEKFNGSSSYSPPGGSGTPSDRLVFEIVVFARSEEEAKVVAIDLAAALRKAFGLGETVPVNQRVEEA